MYFVLIPAFLSSFRSRLFMTLVLTTGFSVRRQLHAPPLHRWLCPSRLRRVGMPVALPRASRRGKSGPCGCRLSYRLPHARYSSMSSKRSRQYPSCSLTKQYVGSAPPLAGRISRWRRRLGRAPVVKARSIRSRVMSTGRFPSSMSRRNMTRCCCTSSAV